MGREPGGRRRAGCELGQRFGELAPGDVGIEDAFDRMAAQGVRSGLPAAVAALWPASVYGSGLTRAFDPLTPGAAVGIAASSASSRPSR